MRVLVADDASDDAKELILCPSGGLDAAYSCPP